MEVECGGRIPFLDVLVTRESDGSISTSVYRKPTHTDKYLDFDSHHPLSHKRSVANTLLGRARSHCSSSHSLVSEKKHISQALCLNSYPKALIRSHPTRMQSPDTEEPKWKSTAILPYVRGVSESLRRILAPLKIRVCFKPANTIKQLLCRPKDPTPDLCKSGVVYKIPCANCPASYMYIGQTGRRLHQRIQEHKRAVRQADLTRQPWRSTRGIASILSTGRVLKYWQTPGTTPLGLSRRLCQSGRQKTP